MDSFVVIADDFTGANDTGMQFYNQGCSVAVSLINEAGEFDCDIVVYNTDSRSMSQEDAKTEIFKVIDHCSITKDTFIYKKIDATFRGNIGSEIEALIDSTHFSFAILCNALPSKHRTIEDGKCMYRGQGVTKSEFATDPKTPVISDSITEIIASQSSINVYSICKYDLRDSIKAAEKDPSTNVVFVVDTKTNDDLAYIGQTIAEVMDGGILIGSSGLASHLPPSVYKQDFIKPSLVIAGTMSPVTINQTKVAVENDAAIVYFVDIHSIMKDQDYLDKCLAGIIPILDDGRNCIIQSAKSEQDRFDVDANCKLYGLTRADFGSFISGFLGNLASAITHRVNLSGILFTGGDIAISCAASLGSKSYTIKGEILPCIPVGYLDGIERTLIATKAGSHGDDDALVKVIEFFRKESNR
ncbi:four-carbon acid sugar kinase family protein [Photobacterium profundum]|uniref:Putative inner membrane protein n=1 Tax=Photobacterium profundum 3TCK TaxID=314280 RepID=Q1ZB63_9GAMM|nr:four-carbon acid sugar kinase family protein [Photobacterium profundum]EAS45279.1 putative inner membrane protein [Photobacterium profundum 3TCK]PSV63525.1 four-carbon acid sugar kinase family protein [Photobacterium profundum]